MNKWLWIIDIFFTLNFLPHSEYHPFSFTNFVKVLRVLKTSHLEARLNENQTFCFHYFYMDFLTVLRLYMCQGITLALIIFRAQWQDQKTCASARIPWCLLERLEAWILCLIMAVRLQVSTFNMWYLISRRNMKTRDILVCLQFITIF